MNVQARQLTSDISLDHVVEPLADLICAADRPSAALKTALATLFRHIEQTNALAREFVTHRSRGAPGELAENSEILQSSCRCRTRSFDRLVEADVKGTVI